MAASSLGSKSLKDYLKRYESSSVDDDKKKKKKKTKKKPRPEASGVLVVDEDPVWQKPVNLEEESDNSAEEEKPLVDEDIEVRRMKRLELLKSRRAYDAIAEDGSGWVSLSPKRANSSLPDSDMSPPRGQRARNDTPSPEPETKTLGSGGEDTDLSPPRQRQKRHYIPSPDRGTKPSQSTGLNSDLSPPRKRRARNDSPSPEPKVMPSREHGDLSPPRQRQRRHHSPSPETEILSGPNKEMSPPRRARSRVSEEMSLSRRASRSSHEADLSPPCRTRKDVETPALPDLSPPRKRASVTSDLSPPRRNQKQSSVPDTLRQRQKTGLISGRDIREELSKTKKDEFSRLKEMEATGGTGKGAEPVYRDKATGQRISKDEYLKSEKKVEEKPKEKKLEWGKGLAQKREAEARLQELELEKDKPFARTRDDPELDKMLKDRVRWGDPMAHLVKKKHLEPVLPDLGNEKMKESGFVIPQDIPSHSWIKRGLDAAPNRYGIRPGRHWDGVDRSAGYEKQLFKMKNEKQATEREAYLWSVSDM